MEASSLDSMTVLNWIVSAIWVLLAWVLKVIWATVRDIQRDIRKIQAELPELYLRKDDFREMMRETKDHFSVRFSSIDTRLAAIFKKIDRHKHQHKCIYGGRNVQTKRTVSSKSGRGGQSPGDSSEDGDQGDAGRFCCNSRVEDEGGTAEAV